MSLMHIADNSHLLVYVHSLYAWTIIFKQVNTFFQYNFSAVCFVLQYICPTKLGKTEQNTGSILSINVRLQRIVQKLYIIIIHLLFTKQVSPMIVHQT